MFNRLTIKMLGDKFRVINTQVTYKKDSSRLKNFWINSNEKLVNNIQRAKQKVFEYAYCNDFKYFVTLTINKNNDREDLQWLQKTTTQIIRDLRKKYKKDFKFILIPELHKDKKSWHLHGLFDDSFGLDFYVNKNGYYSWHSYDRIGFSSISEIFNFEACCKYITKYVTKDFEQVDKGKHCYFCSNNLKKAEVVQDFIMSSNVPINYDFICEWCSIKDIDYNDFVILSEYLYNNCYCDLLV